MKERTDQVTFQFWAKARIVQKVNKVIKKHVNYIYTNNNVELGHFLSCSLQLKTEINSPLPLSDENMAGRSPNLPTGRPPGQVFIRHRQSRVYLAVFCQKLQIAGGGPRFCSCIGILIFWLLRSPCKISGPYNNPFLVLKTFSTNF